MLDGLLAVGLIREEKELQCICTRSNSSEQWKMMEGLWGNSFGGKKSRRFLFYSLQSKGIDKGSLQ